MNPMDQYPPRPTLNDELLYSVVERFIEENACFKERCGPDSAQEIVDVYTLHDDGFDLCKKLERSHDWDTEREDMDALDGLDWDVRQALVSLEREWLDKNNIQPPYSIGTHVLCQSRKQTGVIDEIASHSPGCYLVVPADRDERETESNMRWVCKFERVELADDGEVA